MNPDTKFTVVIALYNKADYIGATLASVIAQTHAPIEILVIDDGSTDGGADLVERMQLPGVRLLRQPNGGVSRARNVGVASACGDWIAFLDADDIWHRDYLRTMSSLVERHPDCGVVGCTYRSVDVSELAAAGRFEGLPADGNVELVRDLPRRWMQGTTFFTSSVAVRRDLLAAESGPFPPGENAGEDLDLWFRLAERSPVALSQRPLVLRVWVPGSLSTGAGHASELPFLLRMQQRARSDAAMPANLRDSTLRFVGDSRISLARELIASGRRTLALPLLRRGWRDAKPHRTALTLLMLLIPPKAVHQWQSWRTRRRMLL